MFEEKEKRKKKGEKDEIPEREKWKKEKEKGGFCKHRREGKGGSQERWRKFVVQ